MKCMVMSGDTFGFLESSWNRGILSRMEMTLPTGAEVPEIRQSGRLVRFSSIRHTSARSASWIKVISDQGLTSGSRGHSIRHLPA